MTPREPSARSDESVMTAVRDGQVAQLGILFDRYQGRIFSFFFGLTGDRGLSDDLLQDVFLRILKYRATFTDSSRFKTWIYRIARNAGNDHFGRHRTHVYMDDDALESLLGATCPTDVERNERTEHLHRAIARLPIELREALVLARFENMKHAEIAQVVGCTPGTVKGRVFRAIKTLQKVYFRTMGERTRWTVHK